MLLQPTHPVDFDHEKISSLSSDSLEKIQKMLSALSPEELELAARTSYEYIKMHSNNKTVSSSTQTIYAARMCQRYLESKNGDVPLALDRIRRTLEFRKSSDVQGIMTAFDRENWQENEASVTLKQHISHHKYHVQGYDKEGRSTVVYIPRNTKGFDKEWGVKLGVYSMERAIACSKAKDGTVNTVLDFTGYSTLKHSPPVDVAIALLTTMRKHYAGQIHNIYIVNSPPTFSILWKMFSPFVGTKTKQKIQFVSGTAQKKRVFGAAYDLCELPEWLCPGGTNNVEWDVEEYLHQRTFDQSL